MTSGNSRRARVALRGRGDGKKEEREGGEGRGLTRQISCECVHCVGFW